MADKQMSQCELNALIRRGYTYFSLGDARRANDAVFAVYCGMLAEYNLEKARADAKEKRDAEKAKAITAFNLPIEIAREIVSNRSKYPVISLPTSPWLIQSPEPPKPAE